MPTAKPQTLVLDVTEKWTIITALIDKRGASRAIINDLTLQYGNKLDVSVYKSEIERIENLLKKLEPTIDLEK